MFEIFKGIRFTLIFCVFAIAGLVLLTDIVYVCGFDSHGGNLLEALVGAILLLPILLVLYVEQSIVKKSVLSGKQLFKRELIALVILIPAMYYIYLIVAA